MLGRADILLYTDCMQRTRVYNVVGSQTPSRSGLLHFRQCIEKLTEFYGVQPHVHYSVSTQHSRLFTYVLTFTERRVFSDTPKYASSHLVQCLLANNCQGPDGNTRKGTQVF
jgi:hypothetical protein